MIHSIFEDNLIDIHHIGSTAIPNLSAKPTIDILIEVKDIDKVDSTNEKLNSLGYTPMGEYGIEGRRYFWKLNHAFHIYVFQKGHQVIDQQLMFRDFLKAHPDKVLEYENLKNELAGRYPNDGHAYSEKKDAFIDGILQEAKK